MPVENLITIGVLILGTIGMDWFYTEHQHRQKSLLTLTSLKHHGNMMLHLRKYYVHILPIETIMTNDPGIRVVMRECEKLLAEFSKAIDDIQISPTVRMSTECMEQLDVLFERSDIVISETRRRIESLGEMTT